jgi:hypothetical protein
VALVPSNPATASVLARTEQYSSSVNSLKGSELSNPSEARLGHAFRTLAGPVSPALATSPSQGSGGDGYTHLALYLMEPDPQRARYPTVSFCKTLVSLSWDASSWIMTLKLDVLSEVLSYLTPAVFTPLEV